MHGRPKHNRRVATSCVDLVKYRLRYKWAALLQPVIDYIEAELLKTDYFERAEFWWILMIIKFGLKTEREPTIEGIDETIGVLDINFEVDISVIKAMEDKEDIIRYVYKAMLINMISASEHYNCPTERLEELLKESDTKTWS